MSFWQRFLASLRGPLRVEGMNDPEVEEDIAEEMPDAAEDARETVEAESVPAPGGFTPLAPDPTLPLPSTIEVESEKEAAREDAAASDHAS